MSARPIGEIIAPIIADAIGLARLQGFLSEMPVNERGSWIYMWHHCGVLSDEEADLLVEYNSLETA